jgi:TP901 family phage tail tape measure protein/lambda family phage tail tape measure protein
MTDTTHTIRIRMDTSGAKAGTKEVETSLQQVEAKADKATQKLTLFQRSVANLKSQIVNMSGALAGLSAGMAALATVNVLAGFDDQMASVRAVTLATEKDFAKLRDTALEMGASTRFTATQAAEGLELLGRAGASASQAVGLINTTLQLAQAENLSLAESADFLVKTVSGMRLELTDAARVADVLSATASKTTTDVRELSVAFRYAAAITSGFKIPIEEVAAALGVLAQNNQTASIGGTAIRGFLGRLAAPTKEFAKDLKGIGLTVDDISPKTNSLIQIVEKLKKAGLDTGAAFDLFKQRAGSGVEILVNNLPALKALNTELQNVQGTLQKKTDIKADTLKADMLSAFSGVQAVILSLGDAGLTRALRIAFQVAAATFRGIAETITALAPVVRNVAIGFAVAFSPFIIAGFIAGIAQMTLLFVALPGIIYRAAAAMAAFAASNPFTALAVTIGLVITLVQKFGNQWRASGTQFATVADVMDVVWRRITSGLSGVINFVVNGFKKMVTGIRDALQAALDAATDVVNKVGGFFGAGALEGFKLGAPSFVQNYADGIAKEADQLALLRRFRGLQENFKTFSKPGDKSPTEDLAKGIAGVADEDEKLRRGFSRTRDVLDQVFGQQSEALASIATLNSLFESGQVSVSEYADQLQRMRAQLLQNDQTLAGGAFKGLNQVAEGVTKIGDNIASTITSAFGAASNAIADFAATGKLSFNDLATSILRDMARLASNAIFGALANGLIGAIGSGKTAGSGLLGGVDFSGTNTLGGLFGFASGGSFKVGGQGGTDSKVVSFRATPGELVNVRTPGQAQGSGGGEPIINIFNAPGTTASVQRRGRDASGRPMLDVVISAVGEAIAGGKMDGAFAGRYGLTNTLVSR